MTARITITTIATMCLLALFAGQADAHTLTMNVLDAVTGEHLTFRGLVTDGAGTDRYPLPADSCYFHPPSDTTASPRHRAWWYATSPCTLAIPVGGEGTVTVRAGCGFEYRPDTLQIAVTKDATATLELTPLTDMSTLGWYSGDTESDMGHGGGTYTCDETDALYTCQAEGMDVIVCETGGPEFTGTPTTDGTRHVFTTYEMRHQRFGHLCPILAQAEPESTVWATNLSPCLNDVADSLAAAGPSPDLLILQNHPSEYQTNFRVSNFTANPGGANWPREVISLAWHRVLDAYDIMFGSDGLARRQSGHTPRIHHIWNSGIKLTATGGTDSALNVTSSLPPGSFKTYAKLDGALTFSAWAEAIRDGHTFATNGPIFTAFTVDGADPGDSLAFTNCSTETLDIVCAFESAYPVKRVDYLVNGSRVGGKVFTTESTAWDTTDTITVEHGGGWISAHAVGDDPGWFICSGSSDTMSAHTSPVWYTMADMRPNVNASATWCSEWCDSLMSVATWFHDGGYATFSSSEESTRVMAIFQAADDGYAALAGQSVYTVGSGGDYATIALALAGDADENDTLILLDGVHEGAGATPIPDGMTIRSQGPDHRDLCTVKNTAANLGAIHVTNLTRLKDITVRLTTEITSGSIAGVYCDGGSFDLRCENVRFVGSSTTRQAGAFMNVGTRGWFKDCVFDSCTATGAGADYPAAYFRQVQDLVLDGCTVTNCSGTDDGTMAVFQTASVDTTAVRSCLFAANTVADAALLGVLNVAGDHTTIEHCTFADNTVNSLDGVLQTQGDGTFTVTHTIISGNAAGPAIRNNDDWKPDTMRYCNLYGNLADVAYGDTTGIISVDPGYATTALDSTRKYMALSGAPESGTVYPRYANGSYMGWLEPTKLPAPTLSAPANGATGQDDPTLYWNTVAWADNYDIQFGRVCGSGDTTTQAAPDTTLAVSTTEGATHYWRARTEGPDGYGPWSSCYEMRAQARTGGGLMGRLYRRRR